MKKSSGSCPWCLSLIKIKPAGLALPLNINSGYSRLKKRSQANAIFNANGTDSSILYPGRNIALLWVNKYLNPYLSKAIYCSKIDQPFADNLASAAVIVKIGGISCQVVDWPGRFEEVPLTKHFNISNHPYQTRAHSK
ncbi:hypothetical protein [Microbulbifer sp. TYP-18]|uniref:hypothetical protein n=1 Tax=Microbulbifer sp. TYP-18 TaxID=3230024 RepID=UPI0034C5C9FE